MADKKKNSNRPASQAATRATRANSKPGVKDQPVKSISEMAHDEAKSTQTQAQVDSTSSVKSTDKLARNDGKSTKTESKPVAKTGTTASRTEPRKDRVVQESKPRRVNKEPAWLLRFRNTRVGRFVYDAYYELRYKVTWPTFEEARNMTIIVIVLSAVIGAALALVDFGLYHLFLLISGG